MPSLVEYKVIVEVMLESWHRVTYYICLVGPAHLHSPTHAFIGREQSNSSGHARKFAQGYLVHIQASRVWSGLRIRTAPSIPSLVEYIGYRSGHASKLAQGYL